MWKRNFFRPQKTDISHDNGWLLGLHKLAEITNNGRAHYQSAYPFPHIVLKDLVKPECIDQILSEFPGDERPAKWHEHEALIVSGDYASFKKKDSADFSCMGPVTRQLIWEMNSRPFLQFLQSITGIPYLISDPLTYGGGLHETRQGGLLKVHADFQLHPIYRLNRRLNLILYLNKEWPDEYGGHLELWDESLSNCAVRVLPEAGTCVIFNTNRTSYHGHPIPLNCPDNRSRKSIALYYYTNGLDDTKRKPEGETYWQETPDNWGQ